MNYKMHILVCGGTGCRASASAQIITRLEECLRDKNLECTNIYISADHSLIAALGENNIPSSVTPVWRPESGFQLQSRDCHSYCFHVHSKKLIS